ncbi:hypothetical protein OEA41_010114 [Lepraria neglecta]|uniref:Uncharacterized protein n=1 Tax=Lepraria neglecta TaxID=209136 RepID=A0AAE0DF03_9LECA|nr:hypothetical protein OEA41_010114 [Lepraria neglecta]
MNSPTLSSSSSFPRGLRLTSFIKALLMLGIFIVVISYTYWSHLTGISNIFTPTSTNVDVDKPTGLGWGMGAMQHYDANVGKGKGNGKEEQAGYDRLSGGTDSGKQEEGGKAGAEEEDNELEEIDLSKGKEAKQPFTQPIQPVVKPAAEEGQEAQEEETVPTMEELGGGNGAAPADANVHTVKGNDESLARPLMDAEDAKKAGLLVSTQAEIEEMDRVGAVEEAKKSAGDKEGGGQTSKDENAAPSMNGKGSEGEKSASVLYDNAQVQDNAADNKTDDSKSAEQTSQKDKTVDEAKLTMGTEKEAKFAAEVKAKTDAETTSSEDRKVAEVVATKESEGDEGKAKEEAKGRSKKEEQGEAEPKEGEGSAKAVADARAKMEEEEAKAKVEMEKKKAQEEHEKNVYAGPKWTPLKQPGERKKSNNLMDYEFLPD